MTTLTKNLGTGVRRERCLNVDQEPFIPQAHQEKIKNYFISSPYRGLLLYHRLGSGKCHKIDTPIMLGDGKIKMVQDIKVGDLLMGDDSTPRTVTSLARGEDEMYEIIPVKGDSYTVNQEHILCLKASGYPRINHANDKTNTNYNVQYIENNKFMSKTFSYKRNDIDDKQKKKEQAENFFNNISHDNIMEMSVIEYLKLSKTKKASLKTYRVPVEFPEQKVTIDPYMIGYWLGDGSKRGSVITTQDSSVIHYFKKELLPYNLSLNYFSNYDYRISGFNGKPKSNIFLSSLKENNLINNKHIPDIYKYNSRENRLKLLAGLIDSDGSLDKGCFEFSQSVEKEKLFDDVMYLARSLGFACYKTKKQTICKNKKGEIIEGEAWRMHISGSGIEEIPTKIPRKQAKVRKQIKDVLVSGIEVKHVGRDNYYGFTLDGNCRYLLGDFTVTHNTCTSIIIADEMLKRKMINHVYVCTPGSLRKNFTSEYCSLCGDQKMLSKKFTFITYNTNIFKSVQKIDFNNSLVIIDEAHNLINGVKNISRNSYALYNQILNSNARVLVLTATVIFNNVYEWCLLGNLLKNDTFPNIVETGELNSDLCQNRKRIFSKENLYGIISYFPGFNNDYPEVIYNKPIFVPMTASQSLEWTEISKVETLRRRKGPPKPLEYRQNYIQAQLKHRLWIMAQKYILSRTISNVHYMSFMIRRDLNEDEREEVDYYLKHFFNLGKEAKSKKILIPKEKPLTIKQLIIDQLHIMAPTYKDIIELEMNTDEIINYIEKQLIINKLVSREELNEEVNARKIIDDELKRLKNLEEEEEIIDEGEYTAEDKEYCKKCEDSLKTHNVGSRKSYLKWTLKNHPDKLSDPTTEQLALFQEISSCYNDWKTGSKCPDVTGHEIIVDEVEEIVEDEEELLGEEVEEDSEYEAKKELVNIDFSNDNNILNICNICMEPLNLGPNLVYKLECSDVFHFDCIKNYVKMKKEDEVKCPVCNIPIKGKINKSRAKPYQYKIVPDTLEEKGGWINKEIFENKLLTVISPKILSILLNILKNYNSKHVIFSFFLEKGGLRLIHNLLKMCGIKSIIYHGDLTAERRENILKKFNKESNIYGNEIKVFLSTEAGFEGITLKEVGHVHFLETNTTPNKILQAIGRAVRFQSHIRLPSEKRIVNIWKYFSTPVYYNGKMKDFSTFNLELNTFDEYYDYFVKEGFKEYLDKKYGKNSLEYGIGTDESLDSKSDYKIEEFNDLYTILRENSIENEGLV